MDTKSIAYRIDYWMNRTFAAVVLIYSLAFGGMLIMSALEGSGVIPRLLTGPENWHTADNAVKLLLIGQLQLIIGVGISWAAWKGHMDDKP